MMENSDREQSEKKSAQRKGKAFDDAEMMETSTKKQISKKIGKNEGSKSGKSKHEQQYELGSKSVHDEEEEEAESSESSEFWMPPPGDRWDFDDGSEDRWTQPGDPEGRAKTAEDEADDDTEMADGKSAYTSVLLLVTSALGTSNFFRMLRLPAADTLP